MATTEQPPTALPADELPGSELDAILAHYPKVPVRDIDMPTAAFVAWLLVTHRLEGDTLPVLVTA